MSYQLLIPQISTVLRIAEDWTFDLYGEERNKTLFDFLKLDPNNYSVYFWKRERDPDLKNSEKVTLPKGSVLKISKVDVRQNLSKDSDASFSSISFVLHVHPGDYLKTQKGQLKKKPRFWAKLQDVNMAQFHLNISELRDEAQIG